MLKRSTIPFMLLGVIFIAAFLILQTSASSKSSHNKEYLNECCSKKEKDLPPGNMIWETLSAQFISTTSIPY